MCSLLEVTRNLSQLWFQVVHEVLVMCGSQQEQMVEPQVHVTYMSRPLGQNDESYQKLQV